MGYLKTGLATFLITATSNAAVINTGETYSYIFNEMYVLHEADPNTSYDSISFDFSKNIIINEPSPYNVSIHLFEDSLPESNPFYTTSFSDPDTLGGILGFGWPSGTWSDFEGLIEIEVTEGYILLNSIEVVLEVNNYVYSSIRPVPLPPAAWLFLSGLGLISLNKHSRSTKK